MKNVIIMLMVLFSVSVYSQSYTMAGSPEPTATITSGDVTICSGDSVDLVIQLTNGPTWDLEYSDGSNHLISVTDSVFVMSVSPTTTTTYTLLSVSNSSCSGDIIYGPSPNSGDVTVTVNPLPLVNITNVSMVTCYGSSTGSATADVLTGMAPYSYYWDNTWANPTNDYLNAGVHDVTVTDANGCQGVASVTIGEPNELVIAGFNTVDVNCSGPNSGAINLIAGGGTLPYSYNWSNGDTTASISGLTAGNYTATVTDANGCMVVSSSINVASAAGIVTIIQPSTVSNVSCNGGNNGAATVSVSGGSAPFTYLWSNGQTIATATGLYAGPQTVTVTDANGCTSSASITITQPSELITALTQTNVSCDGNLGSASVSATGGTSSYLYDWGSGFVSTSAMSDLNAGTYYVTVEDANSCQSVEMFTITQDPMPTVTLTASNSGVSCGGDPVDLMAVGSGGGTYTYHWSTGQMDSTITVNPTSTTMYYITVTNSYGSSCEVVDSIEVVVNTLPTLDFHPDQYQCENVSTVNLAADVTVTGGSFTTLYYGGPNVNVTTGVVDMSSMSAGVYTYSVTGQEGACDVTVSADIEIRPLPGVQLDLTPSELCLDAGEVQLGGESPVGGYFLGAGTDSTGLFNTALVGSGPNSVQYFYTDGYGCTNSATSTIDIVAPQSVDINMPSTNICSGEGIVDVTVSVGGGAMILYGPTEPSTGSYLASSGAYAFELDPTALDGDYHLVYSLTSSACGGEDSIDFTVHHTPDVFISFPADINNLSDTVDYVMDFTPGALVTVDGQTLYGNVFSGIIWQAGQHEIVATVDNGYCIGKDSVTVYVFGSDGIEELDIASLIAVYPNPVTTFLNIDMGDVDVSDIQIVNYMGQIVYQKSIKSQNISLDVSDFVTGMYFIRFIKDGSVSDPIKFIKE